MEDQAKHLNIKSLAISLTHRALCPPLFITPLGVVKTFVYCFASLGIQKDKILPQCLRASVLKLGTQKAASHTTTKH